jgi:hypothetical protein
LAVPVEGLVVEAALVDAAAVPVDRGRTTIVAMITACGSAGTVAPPRICTSRAKADAEQSRNSDTSR